MKRITYFGIAFALSTILLAVTAVAQTSLSAPDQPPLGDYARKIQKNSAAAGAVKAKPKVFDNDNLPTTDKLSIVGAQPPANAGVATPADADKAAAEAKAASSEDDQAKKQAVWKSWKDKLTAQKDSIDLASRELDVLQREYQLRAAAMYADAGNRLRNSGQWDKQESEYKQKIADKQKTVEDAKQKLEDMQEEARKAGVPSSMID
jgi:chromosome segregation ATPase